MATIYQKAYYNNDIIAFEEANLSIASSAVLYGLSVYTVFHIAHTAKGAVIFRLPEHFRRLQDSAKIIGIDMPPDFTYEKFLELVTKLYTVNKCKEDVFVRATIHVDALVPGTRSRGVHSQLSMFLYKAEAIVPRSGARLKTSLWRRIPDNAIPSRAKVNGAYVNSVLARQDAIDSGYDDCIFLDGSGHVCELSAANIFLVRDGVLITPDTHTDLLEGINRRTVLEIAAKNNIPIQERSVDLTELYIADEVFISGTSAFVTPVLEIDARPLNQVNKHSITTQIATIHEKLLRGDLTEYSSWFTRIDN